MPSRLDQSSFCEVKLRLFVSLMLALPVCVLWSGVAQGVEPRREYQVKAAFLHNFARFVEWPQDKLPQKDSPIIIGVIGDDPFGSILDMISQKPVDQHRIVIRRFAGLDPNETQNLQMDEMRHCHMLFVATDQKDHVERLVKTLRQNSVLTIGEQTDFIDRGGMINFLMIDGKTHFEINLKSSKESNITIRSRLSRLAVRVKKD